MTRQNATGVMPRRDRIAITLMLMGEWPLRVAEACVSVVCQSARLREHVVVATHNLAVI